MEKNERVQATLDLLISERDSLMEELTRNQTGKRITDLLTSKGMLDVLQEQAERLGRPSTAFTSEAWDERLAALSVALDEVEDDIMLVEEQGSDANLSEVSVRAIVRQINLLTVFEGK